MTIYTPQQIADILTGSPDRITLHARVPKAGPAGWLARVPLFNNVALFSRSPSNPYVELASLGFSQAQQCSIHDAYLSATHTEKERIGFDSPFFPERLLGELNTLFHKNRRIFTVPDGINSSYSPVADADPVPQLVA